MKKENFEMDRREMLQAVPGVFTGIAYVQGKEVSEELRKSEFQVYERVSNKPNRRHLLRVVFSGQEWIDACGKCRVGRFINPEQCGHDAEFNLCLGLPKEVDIDLIVHNVCCDTVDVRLEYPNFPEKDWVPYIDVGDVKYFVGATGGKEFKVGDLVRSKADGSRWIATESCTEEIQSIECDSVAVPGCRKDMWNVCLEKIS